MQSEYGAPIVNFRSAQRSLKLTGSHQRALHKNQALSSAWLSSLSPEFRLFILRTLTCIQSEVHLNFSVEHSKSDSAL